MQKRPDYGERYRNGEPIATGFVESTVNEVVSKRFCKKQQMSWSKEGAPIRRLLSRGKIPSLHTFCIFFAEVCCMASHFPLAVSDAPVFSVVSVVVAL
jgi:hypothetical protein